VEVLGELEFVVSVGGMLDDSSAAGVGRAVSHRKLDFVHLPVVHQTIQLKFCKWKKIYQKSCTEEL